MSNAKLSFVSEKDLEDKKRKRLEDWEEAKRQNPGLGWCCCFRPIG